VSWTRLIQIMPLSNFSNIYFNIILPFRSESSNWSPSLKFPHQNTVLISPVPQKCYTSSPFQSSWFDRPNDTWWGVQSIKLLVMKSSPLPCCLVPRRPKYPFQHAILENLNLHFSLNIINLNAVSNFLHTEITWWGGGGQNYGEETKTWSNI
jgi:hypothetical protein